MKRIKQKIKGEAGTRKEFDATRFFYSQKKKIIRFMSIGIIVIICMVSLWVWFCHRETEASFLFSQAKDSSDYEEIVRRFSFTRTRPLAMIVWARELFREGNFKEAINIYKRFIDEYPKHNLVPSAYLGLAYCYEGINNVTKAGAMCIKVKEEFANTVWAKEAEEECRRVLSI